MEMVSLASIIGHELCMIYALFDFLTFLSYSFFLSLLFYFLTAEIILTTRGLLYTCLVYIHFVLHVFYKSSFKSLVKFMAVKYKSSLISCNKLDTRSKVMFKVHLFVCLFQTLSHLGGNPPVIRGVACSP